jgi:hypothetical protein
MALIVADRVKEVTTTTGTGTYTLGGAVDGFQAFSAVTVDTDTVYYAISDDTDWEVGIGTIGGTQTTLARTTIFSSSNSNSAVNWGAGTKNIFLTYPAEKAVYEDASGNVDVPNNLTVGGTVDGVDIAARDADLTTTTNTANAALPKAGGTMTGNLVLNADPTASLQAATKQYVDTIAAAGIHYHTPARVEAPANLPSTYDNGTSGVGATLTNSGTQVAIVIDGIALSSSDRVLVYQQTDPAHNGVYTVTTVGSVSTNWVLTRATDADSYGPSDPDALGQGDAFFISAGDTGAGETYVMTTVGTITFGTTGIVFTQISATAIYSAGAGLTLTGQEFSLNTPVASATALATGRTIGMTGDVVWTSAAFDGSGNVTVHVTGTVATVRLTPLHLVQTTTGNYVESVANGSYLTGGGAASEGAVLTLGVDATDLNTASKVVARDASGNFVAGTITAALTGNASTATTLQTARNIGGVSFNGAADINLPGVNTAGTQDTSGTAAISTAATVTTSSAASAFKVPFADTTASTTGNYGLLQDSTATFTYNPSTNVLEAGTFNTTSDISLKENICTFENAMDVVAGLRGVRFTWKKNGIKTVGLIAQEVEKVLPELVGENVDTGIKSVSYANMVAVLIEAVKELKAEIEELKKR